MDNATIKKSNIQIIKVIFSAITGTFGSSIFSFVIGLKILKETNSVLGFGFSQIIAPVVGIILFPFVGGIVDKYNKKKIIILGQSVSMVALFLYGIGIFFFEKNKLIYTYMLLVVLRICDQFLSISFVSSTINIVIEEHIQKLNSLSQATNSFINIFSPIVASILLTKFLLIHFVILEIVMEFMTICIILFINFKFSKSKIENKKEENVIIMFKMGLKYVKSNNVVMFLVAFGMFINFIFTSIALSLPIIQIKELKFENYLYAFTQMAVSIGLLVSAIMISFMKEIKNPLKISIRAVTVIGFILSIFATSLFFSFSKITFFSIIVVFSISISFLINIINIPLQNMLITTIDKNFQARVFNLINTLCGILNPLGILFFSIILDKYKSNITLLISSVLIMILSCILPKAFKINEKVIK